MKGDRKAMRLVARWLSDERDALAVRLTEALLQSDPLWFERGAQAVHITEDMRLTIDGLADALSSGGLPATAARGLSRLAAWGAEESVPWETVATGAARCNQLLIDAALGRLADEQWPDPAAAAAAMRAVVVQISAFARENDAAIAKRYRQAGSQLMGPSGGHRQRELIDDLIAVRSVKREELSFDLRSDHLAVVAWGGQRDTTLTKLADQLGCQLTIDRRRDQDWVWLHGSPELADDHKQVIRDLSVPDGCFLAFGGRGSGREGFAVSHRQAVQAARVAAVSGTSVTLFADVALEAFALADKLLARRFVERQLGDLADGRPRTAVLRSTLGAYFAAGNRATAAATALDVHERTVSYRIRAAEERLGRYLHECQDDVSLALRLARLLQ